MSELLIMIEGSLIGRLRADKAGRLSLDTPLARQLIKHVAERLATITAVRSSRSASSRRGRS